MISILPALHVFSRVLMAFSFAFLVPLGWAWFEDQEGYRFVWEASFGLALICVFFAWNAERIDIARMYAQRWIKEQVFSPDFQLGSKTGQHQQQRRRRKRSDGRTETDLSANKIFA